VTDQRLGAAPTATQAAAAAKDKVLCSEQVIEVARMALADITDPASVGDYSGAIPTGKRMVTHLFDCKLPGYRGWRWQVTVARPSRARQATICELDLAPGEDALLAPAWVPWEQRLQPSDVNRGDRLPFRELDERLQPGWQATDDAVADAVAVDELYLGRARVLSPQGLAAAAQRWYEGDHGPAADGVRRAHASCSSCGFLMRIDGPMRRLFGVCANAWSPDDGQVVSMDHGCGAHSETDVPERETAWPANAPIVDEGAVEVESAN